MKKALLHLRRADPVMKRLIGKVGGYAIEYSPAGFETLARSIVYQQLSGKVASVIYDRLREAAGGAVTADSLLALDGPRMRGVGLSQQKIAYLKDLAQRTASGEVVFGELEKLGDREVLEILTRIKGIGPWTVHMYLIFGLRRPDVLPSGDLGIRVAVQKAYELEELPTPRQVEELGSSWKPYCSVASWYLWRSLEDKAGL